MHLVGNLGRALTAVIAGSAMLLLFSVMATPEPKQAEAQQQSCYYVEQVMPNGTIQMVKVCPNQVRAYPARRANVRFAQPMVQSYIQPAVQPVVLPVNPVQPPELQDSQVIEKIEDVVKSEPQAEVKKDVEIPKDGQPQAAAPSGGSSGSVKASGGSTGTVKSASGGSNGSIRAASGGSNGSYGAYGAAAAPVTYSSSSYGSSGSQAAYGYSYAPSYSYSVPYVATSFAGTAACGCPDCTCEDCNCSSMSSAYTYEAAPVAYAAAGLGPVYGTRQRGFAGFFAGIRNFSSRIRGCR